jgi:hypothetical protein
VSGGHATLLTNALKVAIKMADQILHKNLADKRRGIEVHIISFGRDLEQARRDRSAIIATERVFQSKGPNNTAYMNLAYLFPRHVLPKCAKAAFDASNWQVTTVQVAFHIIAAKGLDTKDCHLRKALT